MKKAGKKKKSPRQKRLERTGATKPKCPNCGLRLSADHVCPAVQRDMDNLEAVEARRPRGASKPSLRARLRGSMPIVKTKPRTGGKKVQQPKHVPYEHSVAEDYTDVEGFGEIAIKRVVSVPGLAYLFNAHEGAWYLLHLSSGRVLGLPMRDEYIVEKVCKRFRYVDWNRKQGWFQTPHGRQVQSDMREYIEALHEGREIKKKFLSEQLLSEGDEMASKRKRNMLATEKPKESDDAFALLDDAVAGQIDNSEIVEDELLDERGEPYDTAYRLCWLGIGHAGNRLVETAYNIGYRRVYAVNTSKQDLDEVDLPDELKLCIGGKGAGKVREVGDELVNDRYEEIMDGARKAFGSTFDRILVCASGGGGTGSGGFPACVDCSNELMKSLRLTPKTGVILALPLKSERGQFGNAKAAMNDLKVMLGENAVSPVIFVDNERIRDIYPKVTMGKLWPTANQSVIALLHYFNRLTVQSGNKYENCDPADFGTVLDSGVISCGQMPILSVEKGELATAFRDNMKQNLLMGGFDYGQSKKVMCLVAGPESEVDEIPALNLDHAFESLSRVVGDAPVHRGIYAFGKSLRVFTMVSGLNLPEDWLEA